jgi:hypothetical protein
MSWDILKEEIYKKWKPYWFQVHPPDVAEYSWNYLFTGGKQIRSNLFCELWKYLAPASNINAELAFAIECIHVASIVLDDTPWMDNALERRGRKTLHTEFSPKKAVLISYELMDIVRNIWLNNKPSHISDNIWQNLLKTKLQRLVVGQWQDIEKQGNLIELASLKTGVLFELTTETVALCLELDTEFWKVWGNNLGILFQWMDDWEDRHQDILQENRNAFNEAYDITLKNYEYLWQKIEKGIGDQWFTKPFGIFMKKYFTEKIPISISKQTNNSLSNSISIPYINDIIIPEITNYTFEGRDIPAVFTGKDVLKKAFKASNNFFTIPSIKSNLWYVDESQWEQVEDVKELFSCAQSY